MADDASAVNVMIDGGQKNPGRDKDEEIRRVLASLGEGEIINLDEMFPSLSYQEDTAGRILDERSVRHPRDSFSILLHRSLDLGLRKVLENGGANFTIGTMCSGSDGPIMALRQFQEALPNFGLTNALQFEHVFSVEIEPFKQAFIDRNCRPTGEIFRNVVDLGKPGATVAMNAAGLMKAIPDAPDILLAGSSCVDFSSLNSRRKNMMETSGLTRGFEEAMACKENDSIAMEEDPALGQAFDQFWEVLDVEGESTKTFFSIHQYVRARRPKIVILENVVGAPWNQITNFWLSSIGYASVVVSADSKHFLVPQTRNRKYTIGVDARHYGLEVAVRIKEQWEGLMNQKNWFAQAPALNVFFLQPSEKAVLQGRFACDRKFDEKRRKDNQAVMCMLDHAEARRKEQLGNDHPYTMNDGRGNITPWQNSWRSYVKNLTRRMKDLLDISFLRARKKGIDFTWKMIILDLGQNVDRQTRKPGTLPCITPGAYLFASAYGRPVLGLEALQMQGIPLNCINVSRETDKQLMDLAGNAMTTTVAGAAILSALIAERENAAPGTCMSL